ncbi:MAG: altronate dehydratase large subunit [Clostridia bacterium]|nr:altronate dehydratase large subunit [Clostridia bacterium]
MQEHFWGYLRPDGRVGTRNHVAVLACMDNVNGVVRGIASLVKPVLPITIWYGRGQFGADARLIERTLIGLGSNPNIASVLVISLEPVSANKIAEGIAATGKRVEVLNVQGSGGSLNAIYQGVRSVLPLIQEAGLMRREKFSLEYLTVGVECGGSDTTSGIASNPCVGYVADRIVDAGGTVILSETSEFMGAEHLLAKRAATPELGERIIRAVARIEEDAKKRGVDIRGANPVPDNIRGGITTIEEKSLGAIAKGGSRVIQDLLEFAQKPTRRGLNLMDTPAPACESMTGLAAGGANLILFSTGVGNIVGNPIAPTVKITGNINTIKSMPDNIDVCVDGIIDGRETLEEAGERLLKEMLEMASGKLTRAEVLGQEEIAFNRIEPTV